MLFRTFHFANQVRGAFIQVIFVHDGDFCSPQRLIRVSVSINDADVIVEDSRAAESVQGCERRLMDADNIAEASDSMFISFIEKRYSIGPSIQSSWPG